MTRGGGKANAERLSQRAIERAEKDRQDALDSFAPEGSAERELADELTKKGPNRKERRQAAEQLSSLDVLIATVSQSAVRDHEKKKRNRKREKQRRRSQHINRKAAG
jgi:hypothetical protein